MSELLPCPFCGGEADEYEGDYGNGIYCMMCGAMVGEPIHLGCRTTERVSIDEAIAAWNTRAERTCELHDCEGSFAAVNRPVWRCDCGAFMTQYTDATTYHKPRFCPNCGAKVIEEEE